MIGEADMKNVASQNFWDQINSLWIIPEIERRKTIGKIADGFRILRCLVRLPAGQQPIVEFNDEIRWIARTRKPKGTAFAAGDPIYLWQVEHVESVRPPEVEGKPVPFVYVYTTGVEFKVAFDFTPGFDGHSTSAWEDSFGCDAIVESINLQLKERAVVSFDLLREQIRKIGLWPAPALIPYPLTAIARLCEESKESDSRELFLNYCTEEFVRSRVANWSSIATFEKRSELIGDALEAHFAGKFTLSVHTLIPQFEGVVTDWAYEIAPTEPFPWHESKKLKKFGKVTTEGVARSFSDRRIIEEVVEFIVGGPVFHTFKIWFQPLNEEFANRHAIGHGRYDASLYTQENSLKAILLLDSLHYIMESHPVAADS